MSGVTVWRFPRVAERIPPSGGSIGGVWSVVAGLAASDRSYGTVSTRTFVLRFEE